MKAVEFIDISKKFGDFYANSEISFSIAKNSVHCILGENGAGKSTLMNILFGIYKPDTGKIIIEGSEVRFSNPLDAIKHNIGMVHQHFMLIEDFTVMENVILGNEISRNGIIDFKKTTAILIELIDKYNLQLKPDVKISELNISQQQKVEILKMLYRDSDILIFDEPTSVLSPVEIEEFFKIIVEFKKEGKTIIIITHKLKEVRIISDKVTVLSRGKVTFEGDNTEKKIDIDDLSKAIVGKVSMSKTIEKSKLENDGKSAVRLKDIIFKKDKIEKLSKLNLSIESGEVHGICGVEGNGQNEMVDILIGIEKNFEGEYEGSGQKISIVPDDRIKKGMIKEYSVGENLILKGNSPVYISNKYLYKVSSDIIEKYDIRLSEWNAPLNSLSGGNQQKVIFAREIEPDNDILLFVYPTRGVDINASRFIHNKITDLRNNSKAILLISSDLDELITLSDNLSILYNGKIIKTFSSEDLKEFRENAEILEVDIVSNKKIFDKIGKLMTGITDE